jgi:hypothetical protein
MTSTALADWRRPLWLALLIAAGVAFTLGFACAMPFAAFAAVAAVTLNRRDGLLLTVGLWLANQIVGFAFLGYPTDPTTLAWGLTLGAVAVLTTVVAYWAQSQLPYAETGTRAFASFVAGFVVYEGTLAVLSLTPLGGIENYTFGIIVYVLALNAVAAVGLYALHRIAARIGFIPAGSLATAR